MKKQLSNKGYTVHVANHGQEALDYLKQTSFWKGKENNGRELSIILMDIEMPVMGGLECVCEIRKWQAENLIQGHIPIIATTANGILVTMLHYRAKLKCFLQCEKSK